MSIITINIEKARDIKKNQIRRERDSLFSKLDVMWMIASERGQPGKVQEISQMKQRLRDATESEDILSAQNIEDLVASDPLKEVKEYLNG
jgi:hypothetical protein